MNFLVRDFYISAVKARKEQFEMAKSGKKDSFILHSYSKDELKKDIAEAENLLQQIAGLVSKKKKNEIKKRIESMKSELEKPEGKLPDSIEYNGMTISPPIFEDLHKDLDSLDEELGIQKDTIES